MNQDELRLDMLNHIRDFCKQHAMKPLEMRVRLKSGKCCKRKYWVMIKAGGVTNKIPASGTLLSMEELYTKRPNRHSRGKHGTR